MYFLIYLRQKSTVELTAVERYVSELVWGLDKARTGISVDWLPQQQTWMMSARAQGGGQEGNEGEDATEAATAALGWEQQMRHGWEQQMRQIVHEVLKQQQKQSAQSHGS